MTDIDREDNIGALKDVIQKNDTVAVFVGAGASTPLGIKGWSELLKSFATSHGIDLDVERSIEAKGYPGTASEIYNRVGDHEKYLQFMSSKFEPRNCLYTSLHELLMKKFRVIVTTNYDVAFENYCNKNGMPIHTQKLPNFNVLTAFNDKTIVYLHGNNDDRKYVFLEEEYDCFYPSISGKPGSYEVERFLTPLITNAHLIFVGFSFDDSYLYRFLTKVINDTALEYEAHERVFKTGYSKTDLQHFVIISDKNQKTIEELSKIDAFRIITYTDDLHVEIQTIIESVLPPSVGAVDEEASHA